MTTISRLDQEALVKILSFADDTDAAKVCRSFRWATQEAMKRVVSELAIVRNDQIAEEPDGDMEEAYRRLSETVQQIIPQTPPEGVKRFRALLGRVSSLEAQAIPQAWKLIHSPEMFALLIREHTKPDQSPGVRTFCRRAIEGAVREDIARQELARLFREVLSTNPEWRGGEGLECLQVTQKKAVAFSHEQTREFRECSQTHLRGFSAQRFLSQERIVQKAELEKDIDMFTIWEEVIRQFGALHIAAPNPPSSPDEIRAWMRVDTYAPLLNRITQFKVSGIRHLPPEIGRLPNLRVLQCYGDQEDHTLSTLPNELAALRRLTFLDLRENRFAEVPPVVCQLLELNTLGFGANLLENLPDGLAHLHYLGTIQLWNNRFQSVPEVLMQMPHLDFIGMRNGENYNSRNEIRELPDFLTRNLRSPTLELLGNPIEILPDDVFRHNESPFSLFMPDLQNAAHLGLSEENLTHIPFRLWFKEHCLLPIFSFWTGYEESGTGCLKFFGQSILNVPLYLLNGLLYEVVEPIVTRARDLLGYDRLVRIRD